MTENTKPLTEKDTAERILAEGGRVVGVDIAADRLEALVEAVPAGAVTPVAGDITVDADIARIIEAAGDRIDGEFRSELSRSRLGPFMALIPPVATPEVLAASITWLLSDDSANINGQVIASDGGWSLQ
ncbi:MAG: hypothetical protein QM635_08140 [Microbacteriaceae bacterium]